MKDRADVVRGWLRKAESDLLALDASLEAGALDAASFHAQQAAEKYLKAFLTHAGVEFPFTHNLAKLIEVSATVDPSLRELLPVVEPLTPYAVGSRYDSEFWPEEEEIVDARDRALKVKSAVLTRMPPYLET
jgi:HEPN domain-containing protein